MNVRRTVGALAAGVAGFLLVGVAVTELASASIEFSLFVGVPAGAAAGIAVAALTFLWAGESTPPGRRRAALAVGAGGVGFLAGLAGAVGLGTGLAVALGVAAGTGVAVGVVASLNDRG